MAFTNECARTHDLAVFIGRFQPLHLGHLAVIESALRHADHLVVLVGSCEKPRDTYNPFTFEERKGMILGAVPQDVRNRVLVLPLVDFVYNDERWVVQVQDQVRRACTHFGLDTFPRVSLIGHAKDHTSFYLRLFPQWSSTNVPNYKGVSSTAIRERFFLDNGKIDANLVPASTRAFLESFGRSDTLENLIDEFRHIENYRKPYENLPYRPIFQTVDAVVVQSGHILLVQRKARPGKGLWALPGGFLGADERISDAVYRELREETKIRVPEPVLRGSTVFNRRFDAVHRSARGRTITDAFLLHLKAETELPKVKGSDDAAKARWWPLADVKREMMFEDHMDIIEAMIARL